MWSIRYVKFVFRGHLNDLENILPFIAVAFFYVLTDPTEFLAVNLFRAFTVARILHTFVYAIVIIPQPSRVLAFGVGYSITIYMALQVILHFL
jgi:glutathione S-transferase